MPCQASRSEDAHSLGTAVIPVLGDPHDDRGAAAHCRAMRVESLDRVPHPTPPCHATLPGLPRPETQAEPSPARTGPATPARPSLACRAQTQVALPCGQAVPRALPSRRPATGFQPSTTIFSTIEPPVVHRSRAASRSQPAPRRLATSQSRLLYQLGIRPTAVQDHSSVRRPHYPVALTTTGTVTAPVRQSHRP